MMTGSWILGVSPVILGNSQEVPVVSELDSQKPMFGVGVSSRNGEEDSQLAPLRAISLLVTRLLRSAQEDPPV